MNRFDLSVPECYLESADFRFFLKWISESYSKIKYDLDTFFDLYDPLTCSKELLWLLADTMGFKFDDRLPVAYNRLVLLYFMSMIRYRGSRDGVLLAANVNLTQFDVIDYHKSTQEEIDLDRLNFTNIRVNSAYVNVNRDSGYIDVVYYSTKKPIDACIEYVRPIGMYCFQHSGVIQNAKTKLGIDVRLLDTDDITMGTVPTQVGRYSREDYASIQKAGTHIKRAEQIPLPALYPFVESGKTGWYRYPQLRNNMNDTMSYDSTKGIYSEEMTVPDNLPTVNKYALRYHEEHLIRGESYVFSMYFRCTGMPTDAKTSENNKVTISVTTQGSTDVWTKTLNRCDFNTNEIKLNQWYHVLLPFTVPENEPLPDVWTYLNMFYCGPNGTDYLTVSGTYNFEYAGIQLSTEPNISVVPTGAREEAYRRNSVYEGIKSANAGYRSLYSLQLANNQNIDQLLQLEEPIFQLGYFPQDFADVSDVNVEVVQAQSYDGHLPEWNLLYDKYAEESLSADISTIDPDRTTNRTHPRPAVNPIMTQLGDAMSLSPDNTSYLNVTPKSDSAVHDDFSNNND